MNWMNVIRERHSVRVYTAEPLESEALDTLRGLVEEHNAESGLHIQLCVDEPQAFTGLLASYGKFENVQNYIPQGRHTGAAVRLLRRKAGAARPAEVPPGMYTKTDLGIARCHFELGAGEGDWHWAE